MRSLISTLILALSAAVATAAEPPRLEPRQGTTSLSTVSCASTIYTKLQIDAAVTEACRLYAAGKQIGSRLYPHTFNNGERLIFAAAGPYQEFPILSSGAIYAGSTSPLASFEMIQTKVELTAHADAPGADRIVINPTYKGACLYVGAMTHTGASSNNGFVSCSERKAVGGMTTATTTTSATTMSSNSATLRATSVSSSSKGGTATTTGTASTNAAAAQRMGLGGRLAGLLAGLLVL